MPKCSCRQRIRHLPPPHRIVADVAAELSDYYENEKFLFSSAMKWRLFSLDVYERLGAKDEAAYAEARVATLSYKRRELTRPEIS